MRIEIKTPEFSESVQSGSLLEWRRQVGDTVKRDEPLADLETDKVILEISAPRSGVLAEILAPAGTEVRAGEVLAVIETEAKDDLMPVSPGAAQSNSPGMAPAPMGGVPERMDTQVSGPTAVAPPVATPPAEAAASHLPPSARRAAGSPSDSSGKDAAMPRPAAPIVEPAPSLERSPLGVSSGPAVVPVAPPPPCPPCESNSRTDRRVPMTRMRRRIAERLIEAQQTAAILTTFNELDMQPVQELRLRYQERFVKEHGVKLGFMSFFVKAACQALKQYPIVNASVDGQDIVYHDYYDIGVAVSSERGLVVPVLRDAAGLGFADIEKKIADFSRRANSLELSLEELQGGTFTISNGGVFGSLMSTPILNPPQSGVLGLHRIQDRPIALNGEVVIRPMMYVALSYDHRIIDGREAVSFLRVLKEAMEDPARLLLDL